VVDVEVRQVVGVAAAEAGVLLEQALLHVVAEGLGLVVGVAGPGVGIDLANSSFGNLLTWPLAYSTSYRVLPLYCGFLSSRSAGQTSSVLKRLENSMYCHRSDLQARPVP
jgi:hypothetical protein